MSYVRYAALVLALNVLAFSPSASAQDHTAQASRLPGSVELQTLVGRLTSGSIAVIDPAGQVIVTRSRGNQPLQQISEQAIVAVIGGASPEDAHLAKLWEFFANRDNAGLATLPIIKALASVSTAPAAREALWSELAALAETAQSRGGARSGSLLALFEQNRSELLPLLPPVRETEGAGDEMAQLMTTSEVFGGDIWSSVADMVKRNPAAVARYIERQRESGQPVKWQYQGFEGLMQWRDQNFIASLRQSPPSPAVIDANGETFISIFNSMHTLDDWFRVQMLKGLGPIDVFNAVVSGEQQLYQLGTSGYRDFLHPVIMQGIKASGTFEAFLAQTASTSPANPLARSAAAKRGLVFMRIASSFGLLDSVLETMRDRDAFASEAIAALGDPRAFESSSTIILDIMTGRAGTAQSQGFQRVLRDRLYALFDTEQNPALRSVYGSMLSAYQTVTSDRRNPEIDNEFALDASLLQLPFARLFKAGDDGRFAHRIFMRMHNDLDGERTFASVKASMKRLGAIEDPGRDFTRFSIKAPGRTIEVFVNAPNHSGVRAGIAGIAEALRNKGAQTIIGRGHTGIIRPLQTDARRVLGDAIRNAAVVIVGTCGSDASVPSLIDTFGFVPFVTTKSSGHQSINNAILERYIAALLALKPGATLSMANILDTALTRFLREEANEELREDAKLYRVNVATALAAQLFDKHLRHYTDMQVRVSR